MGLGSLAASVFLRDRRPALESLQALEKTSGGVISSFLLDSKSDVSMLQECIPDLWREYRHLQRSITACTLHAPLNNAVILRTLELELSESAARNYTPMGVYTLATLARSLMIKELDVLTKLIRRQPGFDRFQLPPTDQELRGLARYGSVAIFNVTHVGSDALLITENNIQVLQLPQLILQDVQAHVSRDTGGN